MRHHRDVFASVRARPGMWIGARGFDGAANFVAGYDQACEGGVLEGFTAWLAQRGARDGGGWRAQVLALAFPGVESPRAALEASDAAQEHALGVLFDLIAAFDEVHLRRDGLHELYTGVPSSTSRPSRPRRRPVPASDYPVELCDLAAQHWRKPELATWLAHGWQLVLNDRLWINFLAHVPTAPWPPPPGGRLLEATSADDAARATMGSGRFLVAPTDGPERIEELVDRSVFWVSRARYDQLDRELAALGHRPLHLPEPRLHDLGDALRTFLAHELPQAAALEEHDRALLCLPPLRPANDGE